MDDIPATSFDLPSTKQVKRKKRIKKYVNKISTSSFFLGCLFTLALGAILQKLYDLTPKDSSLHQIYRLLWFGPKIWIWLTLIVLSIFLLMLVRDKFGNKISTALKAKK